MFDFVLVLSVVVWPSVACVALSCAVWCFEQWRHPSASEVELERLAVILADRNAQLQQLADRVGKLELAQGVGKR